MTRDGSSAPSSSFATSPSVDEPTKPAATWPRSSKSSDEAILGTTLDGIITSGNSGAERLYGYTAEELVGQSAALLIPSDRLDEFQATLDQIHQGINTDHFESHARRKDGALIDVSVKISPIGDGFDHVVGASSVARDDYCPQTGRGAAHGE